METENKEFSQDISKHQEPQKVGTFKDNIGLYLIVLIFVAALIGMILTVVFNK